MDIKRIFTLSTVVALAFLSSRLLQAGQITGYTWSSSVASVADDPIDPPVSANNDNFVGQSPNTILLTQKAFYGIGPADIEFAVEPSGGVTEYFIIEGVDNGTASPWSSYRMELGFGTGVDFILSDPGDGLDFDAPEFDTPADFTENFSALSESEDVLVASSGLHSNVLGFSFAMYLFSIDVPDGIDSFTLRQIPIAVPEPSTAMLFVFALGGIVARRRRIEGNM